MQKPLIASPSNPLIRQARALHQKKARNESGLFLVEGIHHVGEVVEAGWDLNELRPSAMSLEEVFLQLTGSQGEAQQEASPKESR